MMGADWRLTCCTVRGGRAARGLGFSDCLPTDQVFRAATLVARPPMARSEVRCMVPDLNKFSELKVSSFCTGRTGSEVLNEGKPHSSTLRAAIKLCGTDVT
jgi:hypothetical protein